MAKINPMDDFKIFNTPASAVVNEASRFVFRAKILSDRYRRGFKMANIQGPKDAFETSGLQDVAAAEAEAATNKRIASQKYGKPQDGTRTKAEYLFETAKANSVADLQSSGFKRDSISIIDYDFTEDDYHADDNKGRGYNKITLPFIPSVLEYDPASKFVGIATMGRNNPYYQYAGSEDTISFDIDWFSGDAARTDVINSCRWMEALTKADGYKKAPHRVIINWGENNLLFKNTLWLVVAAPYKLSDFVNAYRNPETKAIVRLGLLPQQATQRITLKRVVSWNLCSYEIIKPLSGEFAVGTNGNGAKISLSDTQLLYQKRNQF